MGSISSVWVCVDCKTERTIIGCTKNSRCTCGSFNKVHKSLATNLSIEVSICLSCIHGEWINTYNNKPIIKCELLGTIKSSKNKCPK